MNKIGLIILSAVLAVLCFIVDRHILSGDSASALYKRAGSYDNYNYDHDQDHSYDRGSFDYSDAEGLTAEEFDELYGDDYTLMHWASEYSDTVPEGRLIRVENAWGFFQGQQTDGRTVLNAYWSKGKAPEEIVCDFRNLVDCDEYFAQFDEPPMRDDEYLVSHNEFYMADGQLCTVDITSAFMEPADPAKNSVRSRLDRSKPVFSGRQYKYISLELGGGVNTPCAYDSDKRSALNYIYNGYFSMLLDDYNGDGNPDFVYRTCDPGSGSSYYYMQCMTPRGYANSQKLPSSLRNADSSFFVVGENAPSIRLNRIDRETVFYLTRDSSGTYPVILNSDLRSVSDKYSVNGRLYSSFYEDGALSLKCTCLDIPEEDSGQDETAGLSLYKLNDRMWEKTDFPEETSFRLRRYGNDEVRFEIPLENGVYRMEIYPESGGVAVTEFTVR